MALKWKGVLAKARIVHLAKGFSRQMNGRVCVFSDRLLFCTCIFASYESCHRHQLIELYKLHKGTGALACIYTYTAATKTRSSEKYVYMYIYIQMHVCMCKLIYRAQTHIHGDDFIVLMYFLLF